MHATVKLTRMHVAIGKSRDGNEAIVHGNHIRGHI